MLKIKQHLAVLAKILTLTFLVTCSDIENELAKDFTTSTSNAMFNLTLSVENNITDTNTPVLFTITASRLDTYQIRQDAQMIGFWTLAEQQINGDVQNISQYPMDIEFFAMSVFAGIMGSYGLVSMALWADSLGLPRLDFSRAMANITYLSLKHN